MKKFFAALFAVLVVSLSAANAFAQENLTGPPPYGDFKATKFPDDEYKSNPGPPRIHREDRVLKKGPLAPPPNDREALKSFLQNSNTGLVRLMGSAVNQSGSSSVKPKMNVARKGAYYSFANRTHGYGYGSDIELEGDAFSAGFYWPADYGMLANIGNTPLEEITIDDVSVRPIAAYRVPTSRTEVLELRRLLSSGDGITIDGRLYQRSVPVRENSTYLLRSIADSTSSVLVAFRVVRQESDGSVIIAWKLLKRYSTPKLKRNN
jgi:hypothetical protein